MNWLAHVFLSEPSIDFRLGNLLADIVRGEQRAALSVEFRRGARCHQSIDAFTDAHAVVRRSRARVNSVQPRFGGVLVDVFYDYCLATQWDRYSATPLDTFTAAFYSEVESAALALPAPAQAVVDRIIRFDTLGSYRQLAGVERSLRRVSAYLTSRWHRDFALEQGVADLRTQEQEFAADFNEFFPQLLDHVARTPITA